MSENPVLQFAMPYDTFLQRRTSEFVRIPTPPEISRAGGPADQAFVIPPLNCSILFGSAPQVSFNKMQSMANERIEIPPRDYDWRDHLETLTKPFSQGQCGCCWAVAIATSLSDSFQITGLIPFNPQLSVTYLLGCYSQALACGGGNPYLCLEWIQQHGIVTEESGPHLTYTWCLKDPQCTPPPPNPSLVKKPKTTSINPISLNPSIPPCASQTTLHQGTSFFVKNPRSITLTAMDTKDPELYNVFSRAIQLYILQVGPCIGGYQVLRNLMKGMFRSNDNPGGLYLESVDYTTHTYDRTQSQTANIIGGHAVSIIGWGVSKVRGRLLGPSYVATQWYDVPYWLIRNSWSEAWAEKGCYRHARYPYNKVSQFDVTVNVQYTTEDPKTHEPKTETITTGGILLIDPTTFEPSVHKSVEQYVPPSTTTSSTTWQETNWFFIFIMLWLTVIAMGMYLYFVTSSVDPHKIV